MNVQAHWAAKVGSRISDIPDEILLFPHQLENFIQENVRSGMEEIKRTAVHTQTAAMLEMGTNLLSQSAEQTRKLTDVETQVSPTGPGMTCLQPVQVNDRAVPPVQKQTTSLMERSACS